MSVGAALQLSFNYVDF